MVRVLGDAWRRLSRRQRDTAGLAAAALTWGAGLVLVAAAGQAVVVQRVPRPVAETSAAPNTDSTGRAAADTPGEGGGFAAGDLGRFSPGAFEPAGPADSAPTPETQADAEEHDLGVSEPLPPTSPIDALIPPFPGIELPALPAQLDPVLAVASPSMRQACALTGIAVVAAGLVRGDLEDAGVPVQNLLTYLAPVFAACAAFPEDEPSACAFSAALNEALVPAELALLVGIPDLGGLAIDQIQAVAQVLGGAGLALPEGTDEAIAEALGCQAR